MKINQNLPAQNANRASAIATARLQKSTQKLSSGKRINSAGDDAAGLAISEKLLSQVRGLSMASRNVQDAASLIQTAEGGLSQTQSALQRMRELAVQAASDSNTALDRAALNKEFQNLKAEIDSTSSTTRFNDMGVIDGSYQNTVGELSGGQNVLEPSFGFTGMEDMESGTYSLAFDDASGTFSLTGADGSVMTSDAVSIPANAGDVMDVAFADGSTMQLTMAADGVTAQALASAVDGTTSFSYENNAFTVQNGANQGDEMNINIDKMDAASLGVDGLAIDDAAAAREAIGAIDTALNAVSSQRADLGASQNRLESRVRYLDTATENTAAAESRIRDVDMAKEMATLLQKKIQQQAATAIQAQANAAPQSVARLLN